MDKAVLKKFAIESRQDLMQRMKNKIKAFYIDEEFSKQQSGDVYILANSKHSLNLSKEEYTKRELLIKRINELGLDQVIEEAAYTWFNRIVAIRYMEIHDYLPLTRDNKSLGIRVLSSKDNTPDPEIMKFTNLVNPELDIDFKKEKYVELKDDNEKFKYILLLVCKKLGRVIPQVFGGITDYIDILIPDNLLNDTGIVTKIINEVPEKNYNQVEIIGWLYQYYNQSEKDRVISAKKAYKKNEIPYATQLFTPDWIVKYITENSLVRLTDDIKLKKELEYYIEDEQDCKTDVEIDNLENLKIIDPCCGSGHILVYAFDLLYKIYINKGYSKEKIAEDILKSNLYGLDIDDRAGQLSALSVLLKAREYDKNIFNKKISLNIYSIKESNNISSEAIEYLKRNLEFEYQEIVDYLIEKFKNAKEYGTILKLNNSNYDSIKKAIIALNKKQLDIFEISILNELNEKFVPLLEQAKLLSNKYDSVITNPPYMGEKYMSELVKKYIRTNYFIGRNDMFSTFILVCKELCKKDGFIGLVTPYSWMFLDSYKDLRNFMINELPIVSLIQLEYNSFEVAALPVCTFCLKNSTEDYNGSYIKLSDFSGPEKQPIKALEAIRNHNVCYFYRANMKNYNVIDGYPIAFWLSKNLRNVFANSKKIGDYGVARQGMTTSDNKRFLRLWFEVDLDKSNLNATSVIDAKKSQKKWFPYNKGGKFRKWYGNNEYFVNFYNDGEEMEKFHEELNKTSSGGRIKSKEYYFKEAITWTFISSTSFGVRYSKNGAIFDVAGSSLFVDQEYIFYILGFMCTELVTIFNQILNPTMNVQTSNIAQLPLIIDESKKEEIDDLVKENILLSKEDWDSFELSWDFKTHPLIKYKKNGLIKDSFEEWENISKNRFNKMKENEIKLNKLFLEIYNLKDDIELNISDEEITVKIANNEREIKSLINYAVGCMFGRYSLDKEGIIYTGGEFKKESYVSFNPDEDNIIPITDKSYFDDDIVNRFKKFVEIVYGKDNLNENLDYISNVLSKKDGETTDDTIRRYFLENYFNDHCDSCCVIGSGKRPIYWLLDSGKKNGFKALIYMHRYNENLIPKARLDYLHRIQTTYEKLLSDANYKLTTDLSMVDKKDAQKRQADLNAKLQEIKEYDEKIAHIANQRISIDLDDGVKVNYDKFKEILAKIK